MSPKHVVAHKARCTLIGWAVASVCLGLPGVAAASPPQVAEVTLSVGEAVIVRADGTSAPVKRGASIRVGDRVETSANGHVHMRFVDNAAISVRPDSVFEVQAFSYNPDDPKQNEVRFRVEKGVARSISGAATDVDKSRFRLNTPLAAIGVRGTDFIVRSDHDAVRATVADGTIVVGALGPSCSAAGVGPCGSSDARELSADMGRLMAEVRPGERATRIVPAVEQFSGRAAGDHEASWRQNAIALAKTAGIAAAEPSSTEHNDIAGASLLTLARVSDPYLNRTPNLQAQLVWGRWGILPQENDRVSVPFSLARLNRHVTVADEDFGLFRANAVNGRSVFSDPQAGAAEFSLTRANASYSAGGNVENATITAGTLRVDFARRNFATALDLEAASGIRGKLLAGGDVRSDGIFSVRDADQRVSGAVAHNGREAGYLFERSAGGGLFRGITLWGN